MGKFQLLRNETLALEFDILCIEKHNMMCGGGGLKMVKTVLRPTLWRTCRVLMNQVRLRLLYLRGRLLS